jgi:L-ascorbate metabolism protein UlaG (beta-lactamase superfamily)
MEITYLGKGAFKLKGKNATLVTDPNEIMPKVSADLITVSQKGRTTGLNRVGGTARREKPYLVDAPGEYEVNGIGVFGWGSDNGTNTMYSIVVDGVMICHLGNLRQELTDDQVEGLGVVDVLLVQVGGEKPMSMDAIGGLVKQLQPSWVIPMNMSDNGEAVTLFLKEMGGENKQPEKKFTVKAGDTLEETEVVVLEGLTNVASTAQE